MSLKSVSYTHLFILLSIDTETAPIWAVFLVVANFALSIKVAAKTRPDLKDDENSQTMDTKKRIIDLTLGELMDAIDERIEACLLYTSRCV